MNAQRNDNDTPRREGGGDGTTTLPPEAKKQPAPEVREAAPPPMKIEGRTSKPSSNGKGKSPQKVDKAK